MLALHAVLVAYAWGADHSLPTQLLLTTLSAYSLHLTVHQSLTVGRQFRVEEVRCARRRRGKRALARATSHTLRPPMARARTLRARPAWCG